MKKRAFTLVEIMVVVSLIGLLAALAVSLMLRNRMTTNETVAIANSKTIGSACQSYYAMTTPNLYPPNLQLLGAAGPTGPSYIDVTLASGLKSGYRFIYTRTSAVTFTLFAEPQAPGRTGNRFFYTDETGRITANEGGRAGPGDTPV
ncbi:MAG: type II secretion system protein [Candidatus Omnitrophica bacterium]|nr:type II secretion system protein [Candidatus Omnitrophota bacterium]